MKSRIAPVLMCSALLAAAPVHSEESFMSKHPHLSTALVYSGPSLASSVLISGIILLPVLVPAKVVIDSVEYNKKDKTAVITGKTDKNEKAALLVAVEKLEKIPVKPGDTLILEPTEEGTGTYLKKEGKIISHMITPDEQKLSHQEKMSE
ncbi:STM0539 family protein [Xenorhabdus sp. PB61.4]|uniref:STM0539 family protein n=1 Tax=Xenorhabdus sp. PB61.4 TaxID=2788940 RepID=UPI001E54A3F2|nr:STM0539 family protein [Xenorhabdus sp. PB61.4]MCC8368168.1 STM0539 family protein [Xenorhabdus sp. PB61.4]